MTVDNESMWTWDTAAKWGLFAAWFVLMLVAGAVYVRSGIPMKQLPNAIRDWILGFGAMAPAIFLLVFTLRPLVLFPTWVLCLVAGLVWGPLMGFLYTVIGDNLSAGFAFWTGRLLGTRWYRPGSGKFMKKVDRLLMEYGFMTVLILRLLNLPFDLINYGCGFTRMSYWPFAAGTFLGVIPGTLTCVLFGDAWIHPSNLLLSVVILFASIGIALFMKTTPLGHSILAAAGKE